MFNKLFISAVLLAFCFNSISQEPVITGMVVDQETGEPLTGAKVKHPSSGVEVITDFDGCFTITAAETGINELTVSYVSYDDAKLNRIIVKEGEPTELNIKMRRVGSDLPSKSFMASSFHHPQIEPVI